MNSNTTIMKTSIIPAIGSVVFWNRIACIVSGHTSDGIAVRVRDQRLPGNRWSHFTTSLRSGQFVAL